MSLTPLLEPLAPMESVNGDWSTIGSAAHARRLWSWSGTPRDRSIFCPNRMPLTISARDSSPQPPPERHRKLPSPGRMIESHRPRVHDLDEPSCKRISKLADRAEAGTRVP